MRHGLEGKKCRIGRRGGEVQDAWLRHDNDRRIGVFNCRNVGPDLVEGVGERTGHLVSLVSREYASHLVRQSHLQRRHGNRLEKTLQVVFSLVVLRRLHGLH